MVEFFITAFFTGPAPAYPQQGRSPGFQAQLFVSWNLLEYDTLKLSASLGDWLKLAEGFRHWQAPLLCRHKRDPRDSLLRNQVKTVLLIRTPFLALLTLQLRLFLKTGSPHWSPGREREHVQGVLAKLLFYHVLRPAKRTSRKEDAAASSRKREKSPAKPLTQSFSLMLENLELGSNVVRVYLAVILSTLDRILNKVLLYVHFNGCNIPVID